MRRERGMINTRKVDFVRRPSPKMHARVIKESVFLCSVYFKAKRKVRAPKRYERESFEIKFPNIMN